MRFIASRAGTRGFRAPEVLLKSPVQTRAIDVWGGGMIFLSVLTGRYPFFHPPSDDCALYELAYLYGMEDLRKLANLCGMYIWRFGICGP